MEKNKPKIPPIYNRASNLQRKMELMSFVLLQRCHCWEI